MSKPDIQYFDSDGTWTKPPGAVRADVVLQAGGGGYTVSPTGFGGRGYHGELTVKAIPAGELPSHVQVTIGRGGRPGGRDGYALIITHLAPDE